VFDLERRIYSVDRVRLNPGGVPVRAVIYFFAVVCGGLIVAALPVAGGLVAGVPWFVRDFLAPGLLTAALSAVRIDGRTFHLAIRGILRRAAGPRQLAALRSCPRAGRVWCPPDVAVLPDGGDDRMRGLRYTGPGAVLVNVSHQRRGRAVEQGRRGLARRGLRAELVLRQLEQTRGSVVAPEVVLLASGTRLLVRATPSRGR
jgi:hypothetical protein